MTKPEPTPILTNKELDNMTTPDPVGCLDVVDRAELGEIEVLRIRLKALRKATAQAQTKKIWEWGEGWCTEHHEEHAAYKKRRECDDCWSLLEKGVRG